MFLLHFRALHALVRDGADSFAWGAFLPLRPLAAIGVRYSTVVFSREN